MRKVPAGFRFEPTNEDLFYYLRTKVKGQPLAHDIFPECDIYADKEPWKIFDKNSKESFYVFTKLKRKSRSRIERMAGCGSWDGRQTNEVEDHTRNTIGYDKYFVFEVGEDSRTDTEINGHWIMHEFSLAGEEFNDYVICVIRNKDSKKNLEGDQINNTDEKIRATEPHAIKQGNGSQMSKKRNLNPSEKNQKQKKARITSTMDNIDVEVKKKIGDPCWISSNLISEPIKELEPASSLNLANQFKEEDIMPPLSNLITEPAPSFQHMESTSSPHEFGKYLLDPYIMGSYLSQSSLIEEPLATLERRPTLPTLKGRPVMFDFDPKNSSDWVNQQTTYATERKHAA